MPTKVRLVKAMVFPVVMYGCESWTVKQADHRRIDAFELWCWRRLLRVPWTAGRSQPVHCKGDQSWVFSRRNEYLMKNAPLDEAQAGNKIGSRNINNYRYADDTTLMAESEEELKSLLMKVKVRVKKLA